MKKYASRKLVAPRRAVTFAVYDEATGEQLADHPWIDRPEEDRFLACGSRGIQKSGRSGIKFDGTRAGYTGHAACGSVWACTVCAAKIQQQRAADLFNGTDRARAEKKTLALATFTVRHQRRDDLTAVWDAVTAGWGAVTSGKSWTSEKPEKYAERLDKWDGALALARAGVKGARMPWKGRQYLAALALEQEAGFIGPAASPMYRPRRRIGDQEAFQLLGWARAAEVTHSYQNGWHAHLHVLMVLDGEKDAAATAAARLAERMWERYSAGIATVTDAEGDPFNAVKEHGIDLRIAAAAEKRLAEYLAKDGLLDSEEKVRASVAKAGRKQAQETALGHGKIARQSGRTPFQILEAIDPAKPGADLAIWREWVVGSMGRRQLTTSAGWREFASVEVELTDEEIAAADAAGELVITWPAATWDYLKAGDKLAPLEMVERLGVDVLLDWLTGLGLDVTDERPANEDRERVRASTANFEPWDTTPPADAAGTK